MKGEDLFAGPQLFLKLIDHTPSVQLVEHRALQEGPVQYLLMKTVDLLVSYSRCC